MVTLRELFNELQVEMNRLSSFNPRFEALMLLSHILHKRTAALYANWDLILTDEQSEQVNVLLKRRLNGEPLQYILGIWEFMSLEFKVTKDVLIPRADTEILVECGINLLRHNNNGGQFLDLCTGSGCIGISLAHYCKNANGICADISEDALKIANENIELHSLSERVHTMVIDALEIPPSDWTNKFDVILCNPPYIPLADREALDSSVVDYEPHIALFGGDDGLHFYRTIAKNFKQTLKSEGQIAFEVGIGQYKNVENILKEQGYINIEIVKDFSEIERVVKANINIC